MLSPIIHVMTEPIVNIWAAPFDGKAPYISWPPNQYEYISDAGLYMIALVGGNILQHFAPFTAFRMCCFILQSGVLVASPA